MKGGRKRERNINVWLPLMRSLLGTWPATQACALTGYQTHQPFGLQASAQSTEPHQPGQESILKAAKEKERVTYKGVAIGYQLISQKKPYRQERRGWNEVFEVMKGKDLHPRLLYPAKLSFRMEGQIKCFPDKVKLKEFIITKPLLYEMLKGLI